MSYLLASPVFLFFVGHVLGPTALISFFAALLCRRSRRGVARLAYLAYTCLCAPFFLDDLFGYCINVKTRDTPDPVYVWLAICGLGWFTIACALRLAQFLRPTRGRFAPRGFEVITRQNLPGAREEGQSVESERDEPAKSVRCDE